MTRRRRIVQWGALGLALAGYWLPWLTAPAAALRLNGYELSEWITYLPGVRDGSLSLSRLLFLLPLACLAGLLALAASRSADPPPVYILGGEPQSPRPRGARRPRSGLSALLPVAGPGGWVLFALGILCALVIIPPYPYLLTAYADPEYRLQLCSCSLRCRWHCTCPIKSKPPPKLAWRQPVERWGCGRCSLSGRWPRNYWEPPGR
jgi:hypothetical protein